jgi:hypothetical protein
MYANVRTIRLTDLAVGDKIVKPGTNTVAATVTSVATVGNRVCYTVDTGTQVQRHESPDVTIVGVRA